MQLDWVWCGVTAKSVYLPTISWVFASAVHRAVVQKPNGGCRNVVFTLEMSLLLYFSHLSHPTPQYPTMFSEQQGALLVSWMWDWFWALTRVQCSDEVISGRLTSAITEYLLKRKAKVMMLTLLSILTWAPCRALFKSDAKIFFLLSLLFRQPGF